MPVEAEFWVQTLNQENSANKELEEEDMPEHAIGKKNVKKFSIFEKDYE